jgi:tripartite-type tricarboxylate transporter receptor subunit TctC
MWTKRLAHASVALTVAAFAAAFTATGAVAQGDYPDRLIKVVVPMPAGATPDTMVRLIADKLQAKWGQPVIVENRPGAAMNIAADMVAKAEPDGYTLLFTAPGPLVSSRWLYKKLPFDPDTFAPVTVAFEYLPLITINPKVPAKTLTELIAYAKANPGKLTYASPGATSTPHLATEALIRRAGIKVAHVAYQGLMAAQRDLVAGHIDLMIDATGTAYELHAEGKVRIIAVGSKTRSPRLPQVPAVSEVLPGFEFVDWFMFVAPPKTPAAVTEKLSQAIGEVLRMSDVVKRLDDLTYTPVGGAPAEAAALIRKENDHWRQLIDSIGMTQVK